MGDIVDFKPPPPPGYYPLLKLPQLPPISDRTYTSTWWELDEIFRLYLGQFVVITGLAGSGKSTFVLNLLMNMAVGIGLRTFMYVPENENDIISKCRRIWNGNHKRSRGGFDHFAEYQWFVQSAATGEDGRDLGWVLDRAEYAVAYDDCSVILIDPWNELERLKAKDELLTDYIGRVIGWAKDMCRQRNVTVIMVAHPTKSANGRSVTLADIEGSMNWYNKCDNGLIVERGKDSNTTTVISAKVRNSPDAGRLGACHFVVDPATGLFTPQYGGASL